jgi:glycosyltransferase involved in cell wall biosynthesis
MAPRVALVHDFLLDIRGAERVFAALCDLHPQADLFTAVYDEKGTEGWFAHRDVNTSFLQRLRPTARTFRPLLPLYPYAMEAMDLSGYDIVISSSSAWAHGVLVDPEAVHVCYCHNPFRYAWNARETALTGRSLPSRAALGVILSAGASGTSSPRSASTTTSPTPRRPVAGSGATSTARRRCCTRRSTRVASVPSSAVGEAYAVLSELMPHKRIDVAVEAFNALNRPLTVIGNGPDYRRLKRLAGPTITFAGRVSDAEAADLLARARGLVVTATEEFGIAAVEAQAAGRPVVALREGGARETVLEGETGTFFEEPTPASLAAAIARFDADAIDPAACMRNAGRFDVERFRHGMTEIVDAVVRDESTPREERRRKVPRGLALAS